MYTSMSQSKLMRGIILSALGLALSAGFFIPFQMTHAQTTCGEIIIPANNYTGDPEERTPIVNCDNPFAITPDLANPYSVVIDGNTVSPGETITLPAGQTESVEVVGSPYLGNYSVAYYKHDGIDYTRVRTNYEYDHVPIDELLAYADTYFTDPSIRAFYKEIINAPFPDDYFNDENGDLRLDSEGQVIAVRYGDFYANAVNSIQIPFFPGTYTAVIRDYQLGVGYQNIWDKFRSFIIPTAYAQTSVPSEYIFTITFTVAEEIRGASSVLFLPGIQASRLYTREGGSENRLWEPNINGDVEKLSLDENGVSTNQIYTRDVVGEIFGVSNVYRTFIDLMMGLKDDQKIIKDFTAFAYDWRFSVEDIVADGVQYENEIKFLVSEIENLAGDSYTEKVTIIAHSNGGLVGKLLISELERQGKQHLIDKFVMIGTPQLGTPKAIGVMLHGMEQQAGGGLIVDDKTAREVIKNMPGAYSLLPSAKYFEKNNEPVVTADNSNQTAQIRTYGLINSTTSLKSFLLDTNNTREANPTRINQPNVLNQNLFASHEQIQSQLDSWRAPSNITVYEVAGTGINTMRGVEYRAFPCAAVICAFGFQMKPYPLFSDKGDQTVMAISAGGYDGDKVTARVDLLREGAQFTVNERKHSNLTESPTVQAFLGSIIRFPYLNETLVIPPDFVDVARKYTIIGAHSPVALSVLDNNGRKVGRAGSVINEEIPGSEYIEIGGSTYIVVPAESNYTATIEGTGDGVYSLTVDTLTGNQQTTEFLYLGASTSPSLIATFQASSTGFSNITTDRNGDGQIDLVQTLNGEIVLPTTNYTYDDLRNVVNTLTIPLVAKQLLLLQVTLAEHFNHLAKKQPRQRSLEKKALQGIEGTVLALEKKKLISAAERDRLLNITNSLKK